MDGGVECWSATMGEWVVGRLNGALWELLHVYGGSLEKSGDRVFFSWCVVLWKAVRAEMEGGSEGETARAL